MIDPKELEKRAEDLVDYGASAGKATVFALLAISKRLEHLERLLKDVRDRGVGQELPDLRVGR